MMTTNRSVGTTAWRDRRARPTSVDTRRRSGKHDVGPEHPLFAALDDPAFVKGAVLPVPVQERPSGFQFGHDRRTVTLPGRGRVEGRLSADDAVLCPSQIDEQGPLGDAESFDDIVIVVVRSKVGAGRVAVDAQVGIQPDRFPPAVTLNMLLARFTETGVVPEAVCEVRIGEGDALVRPSGLSALRSGRRIEFDGRMRRGQEREEALTDF